MSGVQTTIRARINDKKVANVLVAVFKSYDYDISKSNKFEREIELLKTIGIDGSVLFNDEVSDVRIYDVNLNDDYTVDLSIEGGPGFQKNLISLIKQSKPKPDEIIVVAFHDQVGEFEVEVYASEGMQHYSTGVGGDVDETIYESFEDNNFLDVIMELYKNNQLVMPENEEDDILDDPLWYKLAYPIAAIRSLILFGLPILLIGWFVFDAYDTALIIAGITSFFNTIYQWLGLYGHKIQEEDDLAQLLIDDAEDLGLNLDQDQAKALMNNFDNIMKKNGIN